MTESGKKWLEARENEAARSQGWDKEAEFWIRAFCEEVERRCEERTNTDDVGYFFDELKRELLGE